MKTLMILSLLFAIHLTAKENPIKNSQECLSKREFFHKHGYLWIKNFFSEEQVQLLRKWAERIHKASSSILQLTREDGNYLSSTVPGSLIIVPEVDNPLQACRAEDMLSCYPDLFHFIEGNITSYLSYLMGEPYTLFKDKLNFKWPGGGAFSPHQDYPAFAPFGPNEHITAMICIDPATLENGCLQVAENWKDTFKDDSSLDLIDLEEGHAIIPYVEGGKKHGSIQERYVEKISWLPLKTSPGDLVLIDSYVPHYSESNHSNSSRRAMFFTLNRLQEGEFRRLYYYTKREDPENPLFHFATPTKARDK